MRRFETDSHPQVGTSERSISLQRFVEYREYSTDIRRIPARAVVVRFAQFIIALVTNSNNVLVDLWFGDANRISEQSTKKLLDNLGLAEYTPKNSDQFIYAEIQEILIAPRKIYFSVSKLAKG